MWFETGKSVRVVPSLGLMCIFLPASRLSLLFRINLKREVERELARSFAKQGERPASGFSKMPPSSLLAVSTGFVSAVSSVA